MQFANPALLFGALLLAVPLIIHLLNRRRHKRRPWAAMEFLLRAYRKQRRRLRRENLLLLLLRCAIPVLLALAIARPSLVDENNSGSLGDGAAHHIFVFDQTYSTGLDLPNGTTPFTRATQLATLMVDGLERRAGQKVSIMLSGLRPQMPLREDLNLDRAKERIASLPPPCDAGTELTPALQQVAEMLEDDEEGIEARVYVFTDLQLRAFGEDPFAVEDPTDAEPTPPLSPEDPAPSSARDGTDDAKLFADSARDAIERIQKVASLTVLDVHGSGGLGATSDNLQVTDLRLGVPHAIAKSPTPVFATILNRTTTARSVQATLEIDGEQPIRKSIELEAGAAGELAFQVTFRELGQRRVRVVIDGDDLLADNARFLVVPVRERLSVLLVEGSDESEEDLKDSTHVRRILDPTGGSGEAHLTPFAIRTTDTVSFLSGRERLEDYDLIVLANVPRLGEGAAESLHAAVNSGTGLLVLLGDRVDPQSYNLHLHRAGRGLMPLLLLGPTENDPSGDFVLRSRILDADHPVFSDFAEPVYAEIFESLPLYGYHRAELVDVEPAAFSADLEPDAEDVETGVRLLATVRDRSSTPLLVAREFGRGKALFSTTSIDRRPDRWSGLDFEAIAFPLLHQSAHWLALPSLDPFNVGVGARLSAVTRFRPKDLAIVRPERAGGTKEPIGLEPTARVGLGFSLPAYPRTDYAGFYGYEFTHDQTGGQDIESLSFAVNAPIEEGDLRYYSHAAAREKLGIESITTDLPRDGEAAIGSRFRNLGPSFLWLTLLVVVGEAAMARWVARRRT